ncbi:MAG: lipopolysaccharide assembly protein LapB [Cellvibrionaceae bacterium]
MDNLLLLTLFVVAIGGGFLLGRKSLDKKPDDASRLAGTYIKGFNFLLNEQPDQAIDAFVSSLEVNSHTLETHLALGKLLRRKGEVDRAIRVHQNLLARPSLPIVDQHQAQLELAEDYVAAGLLDRAERLLQELMEVSSELKVPCLQHLVRIYSDEREWEKAIHAATLLSSRKIGRGEYDLSVEQAHFCCELAEEALAKGDYLSARRHLQQALDFDKRSVRASLVWGNLEKKLGRHKEALRILKRISNQDASYLPEALDSVCECHMALGDSKGLVKYLEKTLQDFPSNTLVLKMAELLGQEKGDEAVARFMGESMKSRPSLKGVLKLVDLHIGHSSGEAKANLSLLRSLLSDLLSSRPTYRCQCCGFSGNELHWLCPSCKSWGSVKALSGVEGI